MPPYGRDLPRCACAGSPAHSRLVRQWAPGLPPPGEQTTAALPAHGAHADHDATRPCGRHRPPLWKQGARWRLGAAIVSDVGLLGNWPLPSQPIISGWAFSVAILVFYVAGCFPLPYLVFFVAPVFFVAVPKVFVVAASVFLLPGVFCCRVECLRLKPLERLHCHTPGLATTFFTGNKSSILPWQRSVTTSPPAWKVD